jgi:hypothetical protein
MNSMVDQLIAAGTLLAALFAGTSAIIAARSVSASGKAIRAQTFLSILNTARDIDFSTCMDAVRRLPDRDPRLDDFEEFDAFEQTAEEDTQRRVRKAIDFLNDIAHLIRHRYLTPEHVLQIYTPSVEACHRKLLDWWVQGFRIKYGGKYYYEHFKFLCENVQKLQRGEHVDWSPLSG